MTVSPDAVRFEAGIPPEAADLPYFISTTGLRLEQLFDHQPESLKVGDAFTRTITVTVNDALSMVLPPLPADPLPGLAVYSDPPRVRDEGGERGERIVATEEKIHRLLHSFSFQGLRWFLERLRGEGDAGIASAETGDRE